METPEINPLVVTALQQWPQNQQMAIDQLRPLASEGDPEAVAVLAWMLGATGRAAEGVAFADQAIEQGNSSLAQLYASQLFAQPDQSLRQQGLKYLDKALEDGWPIDPFGFIQNAAQQNDIALVQELIRRSRDGSPRGAASEWQEIKEKATSEAQTIADAAAAVAGQRDQAFRVIDEEVERTRAKGSEIESLAEELGGLANRAGAVSLAQSYSDEADNLHRQEATYTRISLTLGALSVIVAIGVGVFELSAHGEIGQAAAKAAFGIPIALFALAVNRLAASYRSQEWKLRHVELQIRTTNPFLAGLEDSRRRELLATLALRFFPGQDQGDTRPEVPQPSDQVLDSLIQALDGRDSLLVSLLTRRASQSPQGSGE